jgi:hypothetical protein
MHHFYQGLLAKAYIEPISQKDEVPMVYEEPLNCTKFN